MTAPTTTLAAWLLAQIAADERMARDQYADAMTGHRWKSAPEAVYDEVQRTVLESSRRVLAQCEALKVTVHECQTFIAVGEQPGGDIGARMVRAGMAKMAERTLTNLAGIYADREGWGAWE